GVFEATEVSELVFKINSELMICEQITDILHEKNQMTKHNEASKNNQNSFDEPRESADGIQVTCRLIPLELKKMKIEFLSKDILLTPKVSDQAKNEFLNDLLKLILNRPADNNDCTDEQSKKLSNQK